MRRFEARNPANLLLTVGDNDYTKSPGAFRDNWNRSFGWLREAEIGVAGALGNHDVEVEAGRYQFELLQMPGPRYRRKVGNVELFVLNSNAVDDAQTRWLAGALKTSRARWKIAVFHHPAFTCGAYRAHPGVVARWVPLLERHRVRLVLSGHDHNYQRFAARRGVTYVVHGGGGAHLYPLESCPSFYPRRVVGRALHGWLYLRATERALVVKAIGPAGRSRDAFSIYP